MKSLPWFLGSLVLVVYGASAVELTPPQILAVAIFASFILGTLFYWQFRLAFALIGATALLSMKLIDIPHLIEFANVDIILFLVAMMIVIGFLEERKFFEVLLEKLLDTVSHKPRLFFPAMMVLAMFTAALVDEVTSILFMTSLTLHLTRRLRVNPFPYILMIVLATNIGSSATVVGNPIGVLIALRAGLSFADFLRWATPISVAGLALAIGICLVYFKGPLEEMAKGISLAKDKAVQTEKHDPKQFQVAAVIFSVTIFGLIFHHQVEHMLELPKNTLLLGFPFLMAGICLLIQGLKARDLVEKRVDWWTLIFFLMLFASVGTLRYVGVTDRIADALTAVAGENQAIFLALILFISAVLTAFLDNILVVATFVPIIADLGASGLGVQALWWGLLFGGTFGGNATMIGSTANIVAIGMLEKEGTQIRFAQWLGPGLAVTVPTLLLAFALLYLQLPLLNR
ncbi:MAG: SLC13 family permease [Candidatus Omnitrophica bacterium]|nr:SLC13 family permease [Candidatus Omnitrophota bacterium]